MPLLPHPARHRLFVGRLSPLVIRQILMGAEPHLPPGLRHVAIIMDGNGRWAQQQGRPRIEGHKRGAKSVRAVVRAARELGLQALTLYAFSEQNWERPLDEVQGLMQLLYDYVHEEREEILDNGIRLRTIGNISRLPDFVQVPLQQLVADSAGGHGMTLTLGAVLWRTRGHCGRRARGRSCSRGWSAAAVRARRERPVPPLSNRRAARGGSDHPHLGRAPHQ
jgi:hypothetical protein